MSEIKEETVIKEKEKPQTDHKIEGLKVKKKPKKLVKKDQTTKLVIPKKEPEKTETKNLENANTESGSVVVSQKEGTKNMEEVEEKISPPTSGESTEGNSEVTLQEITEEEDPKKIIEKPATIRKEVESIPPPVEMPEGIEKLISFMKETGGNVQDYARLNADYSNVEESVLLREYYKNIKPHLNSEEVDFILDDDFSWDEEMDDERTIKKKKLAYKEEIAKAKNFLEDTKKKYYEDLKLRPSISKDQQKAMDFFNRYNDEREVAEQQHEEFKNQTSKMFSNEFKGFDFKLGEKKFRYGINNPNDVADQQSNLSNFVKKFLNEDGSVRDYEGYHKAMYAARNADTIAKHFYEQGKTDAIKNINAKSKNISSSSRTPSSEGDVFINGFKVRAISGVDSSKLKIKKRTK